MFGLLLVGTSTELPRTMGRKHASIDNMRENHMCTCHLYDSHILRHRWMICMLIDHKNDLNRLITRWVSGYSINNPNMTRLHRARLHSLAGMQFHTSTFTRFTSVAFTVLSTSSNVLSMLAPRHSGVLHCKLPSAKRPGRQHVHPFHTICRLIHPLSL